MFANGGLGVLRSLGNEVREGRRRYTPALQREAEEPDQGVVLRVPGRPDRRPRPPQEVRDHLPADVVKINRAGLTSKCLEDVSGGPEAESQGALPADVVFDDLSELHTSSPRSKTATSRRPWRSTLA